MCKECECPQISLPVCLSGSEVHTELDENGCLIAFCLPVTNNNKSGSTIISEPEFGDSYTTGESIEILYSSDIPFIIPYDGDTGDVGGDTGGVGTYIGIVTDDNTVIKAYPDFNHQSTSKNPEPEYANEDVYNSVVFKYTIQPEDVSKEPFLVLSEFQNSNFKFDTNDDKSFVDEAIKTDVRLYLKNPNKYKINSGPTFKNTDINLENKKYNTGDILTISIELDQPVSPIPQNLLKDIQIDIEYGNDLYASNRVALLNNVIYKDNSAILEFNYTITDKDYFDSSNKLVSGHFFAIRDVAGLQHIKNANTNTNTLDSIKRKIISNLNTDNLQINGTKYIDTAKTGTVVDLAGNDVILVINKDNTISIIDLDSLKPMGLINSINQEIKEIIDLGNDLVEVLTADNSIYILDGNNSFRIVNIIQEIDGVISDISNSDNLLIVATNKGIYALEINKLKPDTYTITKIFDDKSDKIFMTDDGTVYSLNRTTGLISVIDSSNSNVINSFNIDKSINDFVVTNGKLYGINNANTLFIYDVISEQLLKTSFVSSGKNSITLDNNNIYISSFDNNTITIINTLTDNITQAINSNGNGLITSLISGDFIYGIHQISNNVVKINTATNEIIEYCPPAFFNTELPPLPDIT